MSHPGELKKYVFRTFLAVKTFSGLFSSCFLPSTGQLIAMNSPFCFRLFWDASYPKTREFAFRVLRVPVTPAFLLIWLLWLRFIGSVFTYPEGILLACRVRNQYRMPCKLQSSNGTRSREQWFHIGHILITWKNLLNSGHRTRCSSSHLLITEQQC